MKVLVTGASGLVGSEVAGRLLESGHEVYALVHSTSTLLRNTGRPLESPGLHLVPGDVATPGLGDLPPKLDRVVHCAALTDFGRPRQQYRSVNVAGTRHVLELARAREAPVVHVSTAYVCGQRSGIVAEDELDVGQRLANDYEQSKFDAEILVRKAATDGQPVTVVRPSIVVGTAGTGAVRDFKNIYVILKLTTQGRVRSLPGHFDARLDLVPVDHVAGLIVAATERFSEAAGRTFHAVGGGLRLHDFSEVLAEFPSFHVPRFVSPATFDPDRLPEVERAYHRTVISLYQTYFTRRIEFDAAAADALLPVPRLGRPFLRRLLRHALRAGYLGSPLPSVAEVLAEGP